MKERYGAKGDTLEQQRDGLLAAVLKCNSVAGWSETENPSRADLIMRLDVVLWATRDAIEKGV